MRIMHVFETLERKARDARAAERESRRGAGPGAAARKRLSTFNSVGSAIRRGSSMSLRKPRTELAERQRSASSRKAWVGLASNDDKEVAAQIIQRNLLRSKRRRSWTGWDALIKDIQSDVREKREAAKRPAVASQVLSLEQRVAGVETKLETMQRLIVAGFDDLRRGHRPPPRGPAPARALHDAPALARTPVAPPAPSRLSFPPAEAAAPPAPRAFTPVAPRSPVARAAAAPAPPAAPQTPFERHVAAFRAAAADDAAASRLGEHSEDPRLNPTAGED